MQQIIVEESAVIGAPASKVYDVIADYRNGHPNIVPKKYFKSVEIEYGGVGAGTIIRVVTQFLGREQHYRMLVEEPDQGKVISERDLKTGTVTYFTIKEGKNKGESIVTIKTEMPIASGLKGMIEKLTTPPMMKKIYREELAQLNSFVSLN
ncbi:MAG TPA: SRPBCC family protein [Candidatus Kapabacteria bacterium]